MKCKFCDFESLRLAALVSHEQRRHGAAPKLKPRGGDKRLKRGDLDLNLKCVFCRSRFARVSNFEQHHQRCKIRAEFYAANGIQDEASTTRPFFIRSGNRLVTWISAADTQAEAEAEWRALS